MSEKPEILLETTRFSVERLRQKTSAGWRPREVIRHLGSATIVPMVDKDHVCLIQNYRISVDQTLIELPAGTLEPAERPDFTAARELSEETGYVAGRIELLGTFFAAPGILDELMHLYLATDLTAGPTAREAGEQIENLVVSWSEAMALVDQGRIRDAKTLVGLLICDRIRNQPKQGTTNA